MSLHLYVFKFKSWRETQINTSRSQIETRNRDMSENYGIEIKM